MEIDFQNLYTQIRHVIPINIFIFLSLEFFINLFIFKTLILSEAKLNIISGLVVLATQVILQSLFLSGIYPSIYKFHLFEFGNNAMVLLYGFIIYTFLQFVSHFLSHKIRIFWCLHEVHHSATQMNSTAGLRNSIFDIISTDVLYLLIPLIGIPPIVYLVIYSLSKAWGNFIHINEQIVSKIPFLNIFLVDPSTHHLHHARNDIYLDKNFCVVTPIYDKIFGTFVVETELPVYGSASHRSPTGFWDIHLFEFRKLLKDIRKTESLKNKILYIIMPPNWEPKNQNSTDSGIILSD